MDSADILVPQGLTAEVGDAAGFIGGQDPGWLDADHEGGIDVKYFKLGHGDNLVS